MLYLGGDYEDVLPPAGGTYNLIQRIQVTDVVRQVRRRLASTGAWEAAYYEYVHRDHLGSVDAITNSAGVVQRRFSFDPFGGRRSPTWNGDLDATGLAALLAWQDSRGSRGFTDHEHLNRTGFVHMNGRVYDPRIGRFVSPDPIVPVPSFSQSYNRYAYAFNNPLTYVDPTGFNPLRKLKKGISKAFKKVTKFVKKHAIDIAITVVAFAIPGSAAMLEGFRGFVVRGVTASAGVTVRRRSSRAGPDPGGPWTTPGIAGPVTVFGLTQSLDGSTHQNPPDIISTPQIDGLMVIALRVLATEAVEQVFELDWIDGVWIIRPARLGTEDRATARVSPHTRAVGHTHVRASGDRATTQSRELPGPGDHLVVAAGVPNFILTPSGAIRVVERVSGEYRVRTVQGDDARRQGRWKPGRCDSTGCRY